MHRSSGNTGLFYPDLGDGAMTDQCLSSSIDPLNTVGYNFDPIERRSAFLAG